MGKLMETANGMISRELYYGSVMRSVSEALYA